MKIRHLIASVATLSLCIGLSSCTSTKKDQGKDQGKGDADEKSDAYYHSKNASGGKFKNVYFDFDKYDIRADQQPIAKEIAEQLKKDPKMKVEIQGHTDDRGSSEYNMALGTRRANSLKNYLSTFGVAKKHIEITSFGKERPAADGQNEAAWARNRRDEIVEK